MIDPAPRWAIGARDRAEKNTTTNTTHEFPRAYAKSEKQLVKIQMKISPCRGGIILRHPVYQPTDHDVRHIASIFSRGLRKTRPRIPHTFASDRQQDCTIYNTASKLILLGRHAKTPKFARREIRFRGIPEELNSACRHFAFRGRLESLECSGASRAIFRRSARFLFSHDG